MASDVSIFFKALINKATYSFKGIITCVLEFSRAVVVDLDHVALLWGNRDTQGTREWRSN
jgi:hypothetical protein